MLLGIKQAQASRSTGSKQLKESIKVMVQGTSGAVYSDEVTSIRNYAFYQNAGITSADFPNVTLVGACAFQNASNLTSVSLPNLTTFSGSSCFVSCTNLVSFEAPKASLNANNSLFSGCTKLKTVKILNSSIIPSYAFYNCTALTDLTITGIIPSTIKNNAFQNCRSLAHIGFNNVNIIETYAFYNCTSLTTVEFNNVTTIQSYAFQNCTSLTSIDFGCAISTGLSTFSGCVKVRQVRLRRMPTSSSVFYDIGNSLSSEVKYGFSNIKTTITLIDSSSDTVLDYVGSSSCPLTTLFVCSDGKYVAYNHDKGIWCKWIDASTPDIPADAFTLLPDGLVGYQTNSFNASNGTVAYDAGSVNSDGTVSVMAS